MGYMKIKNLYAAQDILLFREAFCLEKVHGSSGHVRWNGIEVGFHSGGCKHDTFVALFDTEELQQKFIELGHDKVIVYGEVYGGKIQGMKDTYGDRIRFIAFEVKIDDCWLDVPNMDQVATDLGFEVVPWHKVSTNLDELTRWRDIPSEIAIRRGCGEDKKREGIVLRPPIEVVKNNGERMMAKYKAENFRETKSPRPIGKEKLKVLEEANAIADEWCTEMRLTHVLDAFPEATMEQIGDVIKAMISDIEVEAANEIVSGKEVRKAIGKKTANMIKARIALPQPV